MSRRERVKMPGAVPEHPRIGTSPTGERPGEMANRCRRVLLTIAGHGCAVLRGGPNTKHPVLDRAGARSAAYAKCRAPVTCIRSGENAGRHGQIVALHRQRLISWKAHIVTDAHPDLWQKRSAPQTGLDRRDGSLPA